ncbi:PREDICTED: uncharacterized protein LOC106314453 [Brassica oleracea var. oleracea]|uniref:uncharacterized protein LOC106314453 n=1 Tax=Brassica oleracea var. oleracea TaxID=109376 RepID=UPI0006A70132|nr:PREDICTED: uncharacterized protein LOC106314453 [Brassica oleracea var. oleracea]
MDHNHQDPSTGLLTKEFAEGLGQFMAFASNQETTLQMGKMYCPCPICQNRRFGTVRGVWKHLYSRGFMAGYKVWYSHGETDLMVNFGSISQQNNLDEVGEQQGGVDEHIGNVQMVEDRFRVEEPKFEAQIFFDMLDAAKTPLYDGCRDGISPMSSATRMMSIKTDYNLSEDCVDAIADFVKDILPEDNLSPATYYEIHVSGLGLPYQMIDVCIDNCMIYWRRDVVRTSCRFCGKPRFQETRGKSKIPYKIMWYLPITDRLKRLYQSKHTAEAMRWHGEHESNREISHPSDAKAWKHFQSMYPSFAFERRNVYLGLSSDGFNLFGRHRRQYSLWPVIVTPYNLPPSLCMKREFLFLTILVPGPEHPKRSLDVFLQPLIYELKMLWDYGVEVYDIASKENFMMRAVLMWTINDFPAYGMLSG